MLQLLAGSGLLAMMAARAGAVEVHSVEMVTALATAAKHIVAQNGFGDRVSIHRIMSTQLDPADVGGLFDVLVCEIVDDQLLGEGVLTTIADARRRLLTPDAAVIPCGAAIYALPIEMRIGERAGFALDELNTFATDMSLAPRAHAGCKLQRFPAEDYKVLAKPIKLFDFDFARTPIEQLAKGRTNSSLFIEVERSGLLTAFLIYFDLRCDTAAGNRFSNGPATRQLVAWDQSMRCLPLEVRLTAGQRVPLTAEHDFEAVRVGVPQLHPSMFMDTIGHREILNQR